MLSFILITVLLLERVTGKRFWLEIVFSSLLYGIKGALSGLRQIAAAESPLKMKNVFYLTSKALFVLKIFKFLSWLFGHVATQLDEKNQFNFKFYDATAWFTNNCNTHIVEYLEK